MSRIRPISSVHVDIAKFAWIVSRVPQAEKADWLDGLVECLVKRDPDVHEYGADLLQEVEEFRNAEIERKSKAKGASAESALSKESALSGLSKESALSPEEPPRSDQIRADHGRKENTPLGEKSLFLEKQKIIKSTAVNGVVVSGFDDTLKKVPNTVATRVRLEGYRPTKPKTPSSPMPEATDPDQ